MSKNKMEEKLLEIINKMREKKEQTRLKNLSTDLVLMQDLNFDSFDLAELTVRIEDEFGVDIFEDGFVRTVSEILDKLK